MPYKPGARPSTPLGECGHPTWRDSKVCRSCYLAGRRKEAQSCACGAPISTARSKQCRACWMRDHMAQTSRPKCIDCGALISWQVGRKGNPATRCRPCNTAYRKTLPKRGCKIEGCERIHLAQGLCRNHYSSKNDSRSIRAYLKTLPCAACGLDDPDAIQIDRAVRDLGYTWGNVVQVCANCHQKITLGKLERPAPWMAPPSRRTVQ